MAEYRAATEKERYEYLVGEYEKKYGKGSAIATQNDFLMTYGDMNDSYYSGVSSALSKALGTSIYMASHDGTSIIYNSKETDEAIDFVLQTRKALDESIKNAEDIDRSFDNVSHPYNKIVDIFLNPRFRDKSKCLCANLDEAQNGFSNSIKDISAAIKDYSDGKGVHTDSIAIISNLLNSDFATSSTPSDLGEDDELVLDDDTGGDIPENKKETPKNKSVPNTGSGGGSGSGVGSGSGGSGSGVGSGSGGSGSGGGSGSSGNSSSNDATDSSDNHGNSFSENSVIGSSIPNVYTSSDLSSESPLSEEKDSTSLTSASSRFFVPSLNDSSASKNSINNSGVTLGSSAVLAAASMAIAGKVYYDKNKNDDFDEQNQKKLDQDSNYSDKDSLTENDITKNSDLEKIEVDKRFDFSSTSVKFKELLFNEGEVDE